MRCQMSLLWVALIIIISKHKYFSNLLKCICIFQVFKRSQWTWNRLPVVSVPLFCHNYLICLLSSIVDQTANARPCWTDAVVVTQTAKALLGFTNFIGDKLYMKLIQVALCVNGALWQYSILTKQLSFLLRFYRYGQSIYFWKIRNIIIGSLY